jgi:site-specific DNA-methyltransferase (adenine-specific)
MTTADTMTPVLPATVEPESGAAVRVQRLVSRRSYYQDNNVTLYHADCRDVLPELEMADLLLTDPPYGVNYASNMSMTGTTPITNDGARISLRLYKHVIPMLNAKHWLWFTRWDAWPDVWEILAERMPIRGLLVWEKNNIGMGDLKHWGTGYELICSAGYGNTTGKRDGGVLHFDGVAAARRVHPTEKPVALMAYLIEKMGAQTILDPFAGGGATLVAAKQLGRQAVGIECEEKYCEAIAKRLSQEMAMGEAANTTMSHAHSKNPTAPSVGATTETAGPA